MEINSKICPNSSTPSISMNQNINDVSQAYQTLYQASPYIKLSHFISSQSILEAFESKQEVHIIDLDIRYGFQWPPLIQALAARPGGPPFLRITGIGSPLESVRQTGNCLIEAAKRARVPFEFHPVEAELQNLRPSMLQVQQHGGETLAVNLVNWPRCDIGNCLGRLLTMIRGQGPSIVTLTQQEPSELTSIGRFTGAFRYYSAIFESLDAAFPGDSPARGNLEKCIFAPAIRKEVASEEPGRAARRQEGLDVTVKLMEEKGFRNAPVREETVAQAKMLLSLSGSNGHTLIENKGCLQLGWRGTTITSTSAWRC